jgi:hypothetical protein
MRWAKRGRIFHADGQFPWLAHHASVPVPDQIEDGRLRVYFGPRDAEGRTRVGFIEVDPEEPSELLHIHERPALGLGKLGTFDDSGAMPCCTVDVGTEKYLYYIGWNRGVSVPYRNSIGLAVSTDGGVSFDRPYQGPIVDRSRTEPYFTTTPFVLRENGTWRMWYSSGTGWLEVHGRPEPLYEIKYGESADGLEWTRDGATCIAPRSPTEANTRPWVVRDGDAYRMWYCYRDSVDYRTNRRKGYRIGYAESRDGIEWTRKDEEAGITVSEEGWDSQMIEYPSVYDHLEARHLLYNGNGFGESGIGHAVLEAG